MIIRTPEQIREYHERMHRLGINHVCQEFFLWEQLTKGGIMKTAKYICVLNGYSHN